MCKQTKTNLFRFLTSAIFLLALASSIWAVDGTVQINQSKANNGNLTPGDTPGFPVTISKSGSYRLAGNLTVPDANTTAIEITTNDVTLDLNGFAILGPTVCSNYTCAPTGTGKGVFTNPTSIRNTTIVNGSVRGMGSDGIYVGYASRAKNVASRSNGGYGIHAAGDSIVSNCISHENGQDGIAAAQGSLVTDNTSSLNGGDGINGFKSTVIGNTVYANSDHGIVSVSEGNVARNTSINNGGYGLYLGNDSGYGNNVVNNNKGGNGSAQVYQGKQIGTNVCGGDTSCP